MKKLLALILPFGIIGCAINTPLIIDVRDSGQIYDDWQYYTYDDDFDGKYLVSMAKSNDNKGFIRIFTSTQSNNSSLEYENGDSYICSIYSGLNTEMIFTTKNGDRYESEVYLSLSSNRESLIARSLGGNENQLVSLLNTYDNLKIRTIDSCGNKVVRIFNISGTTHLKPYDL